MAKHREHRQTDIVGKMEKHTKWLIGIFITVLSTAGLLAYKYGRMESHINGRVDKVETRVVQNEKKIEKVEERMETIYTLFDARLNTIIIGLGDLKVQGEVNASQLKTVRDDVKQLKAEMSGRAPK